MPICAWAVDGAFRTARGTTYGLDWEDGPGLHFAVEDVAIALRRQHCTDVRWTPIVIVDSFGMPVPRQRRLIQSSAFDGLGGLREYGYDAVADTVVADFELRHHEWRRMNAVLFESAWNRIRPFGLGLVSTRGGVRPIQVFEDVFPVEEYRHRNQQLQDIVKAALPEFVCDAGSAQWTTLYRTPWNLRDGELGEPWIELDVIEPYALEPVPESELTDCCIDVIDTGEYREESDSRGLDRMRAYADVVLPPVCGSGLCRQTLWNICLQCHLFGLCKQDALKIVHQWVSRSGHSRREWSAVVLEETVIRAMSSPYHSSGARLRETDFTDDLSEDRQDYSLLEQV